MNLYLLQLVGKWIGFLCISFVSLFGTNANVNVHIVYNENLNKNHNVVNTIESYQTEYRYNTKLPNNIKKTLVTGVDGIYYEQDGEKRALREVVHEVIEVGTGDYGEYTGRLTGYGADCYGCSSVGNVACYTRECTNHSLTYDGMYYQDYEYGQVRILAADNGKFPCGTIVQVDDHAGHVFYGVVLDTGYSMRNAWANGTVWMDLAYQTQAEARVGGISGFHIDFHVQRWGW